MTWKGRQWAWTLALLLVTWAGAAHAYDLRSAGGQRFDIQEGYGGELSDGTSDSYDGCYYLSINGIQYRVGGGAATIDGRTVRMPTVTVTGSLDVSRTAYVPETGGDFVRYYDTITNTGDAAAVVAVRYHGNLGSDGSTTVWGSSSGDTTVSPADYWYGTDDTDGSGDPSLAHVFHGEGGSISPATQTLTGDNLSTEFEVAVGPGETVAFLAFAFQGANQAAVRAQVEELMFDVASATDDMDGGDLSLVVNFGLGGAPLIRWAPDQLFEVPEGGELELNVTVEDREGDETTTSWDLDDDGDYDDADGLSAAVSAAGLDGPTSMTIGIRSSDSEGNVAERHREIMVLNAPPVFTNLPEDTTILIGQEWSYTPELEDPGDDEITVEVIDRPPGMVLLGDGGVRWTPNEDDVGERTITFFAHDDEDDPDIEGDGDVTQVIVLTVSENQPPGTPRIVSPVRNESVPVARPTLVVETPTDPEGDTLTINFEVSDSDTYTDPIASGPQAPGLDGTTSWTIPVDLDDGQLYNWRVWAYDGHVRGPAASSLFRIVLDGDGGPDAGDGGPDDGGADLRDAEAGCRCQSTGSASGSTGLLVLLLALGVVLPRFRRKRRS